MADAHVTQNIHDLTAKLDQIEQAYQQIAVSIQQYQAQLTDMRQQLATVARDAGHSLAAPPPPVAVAQDATQGYTPPVPSPEAEAARIERAQGQGMPVNVPPPEEVAKEEAEGKDAEEKPATHRGTRQAAEPDTEAQTRGSHGRGSHSASSGDKDKK